MTKELVLYTNPMSRGRIARWMLEETGADYDVVVLQYGTTMKAPEYLAINPMGKVPALRHGDTIVTECAACCAYLADVFPEAGLAPALADRADYYRWLFFAAGPIEASVTNKSMGFDVPADKQGMVGYGNYESVLDTLESKLDSSEYLCSNRFTAADVYLGSQIGFGLQFNSIEPRQVFSDYWQRISNRDAYRNATSLDDALIES